MADSTSNMPQMSSGQAAKEVTFNEVVDPLSPAALFGRNADTTAALTWGYLGGKYRKADGTVVSKANSTVALTASVTNYILETDGVVSLVTAAPTGWPGPLASGAKALYEVVTGVSGVTSYTDHRTNGLGSGNATVTQPFDVTAFYPGVPTASALVLRVPIARAVTFAANFAGSYGKASVASTGTATFDIQKNGSSVGSMVFTASAAATFTSAGGAAVSFAAGDVLAIVSPGSADATLADVGVVLAGTR